MTRIHKVSNLLNVLVHSNVHDTVKINKAILIDIQICLEYAHDKIEFLQLES